MRIKQREVAAIIEGAPQRWSTQQDATLMRLVEAWTACDDATARALLSIIGFSREACEARIEFRRGPFTRY
jgi:hypothetical protein